MNTNFFKSAAVILTISLLSACGGGGSSPAASAPTTPVTPVTPATPTTNTGIITYWTTNTALVPMGVAIDGVNIGQVSAATPIGIDPLTGVQARPACGSNTSTSVSKVLSTGAHTDVLTVGGAASLPSTITITANTCTRMQIL